MMSETLRIQRLRGGTLFKVIFIGNCLFFIPFSVLMGILSFFWCSDSQMERTASRWFCRFNCFSFYRGIDNPARFRVPLGVDIYRALALLQI